MKSRLLLVSHFNPRSHKGSDNKYQVSFRRCKRFQSTLPQGERRIIHSFYPSFPDFNPRSHKGSDVRQFMNKHIIVYFNPRSHKGSDIKYWPLLFGYAISIHAPTRGATRLKSWFNRIQKFQSTLPQGERQYHTELDSGWITISIHAPTRGAT